MADLEGSNWKRSSKKRRWISRLLLVLLLLVFAIKFQQFRSDIPWKITTQVQQEEQQTINLVEDLLSSSQAIQTTIHSHHPPMEFPMLLFPTSVDKFITKKLLQNPVTYEQEVSLFLYDVLNNRDGSSSYWAVDLGANVGLHTLYMASLGASVIALEPAPDTARLLRGSLTLNPDFSQRVTLIEAGASDSHATGQLARHAESPGMTTLATTKDLPWSFRAVDGKHDTTSTKNNDNSNRTTSSPSTIQLVPVEEVLDRYIGVGSRNNAQLRLLKIDVEGYELHALRGLNLAKYPFEFLLFEFFPQLIRASGSDPVEVLEFVVSSQNNYTCAQGWSGLNGQNKKRIIGNSRQELEQYASTVRSHTNIFCEKKKR